MSRARADRVASSKAYGRAMASLERLAPELAAPIRIYVQALHAEAAEHRVQAPTKPASYFPFRAPEMPHE